MPILKIGQKHVRVNLMNLVKGREEILN